MKNKYAISLVLITILLFGSMMIGTSYSLWEKTKTQSGENKLTAGCFSISFLDSGFEGYNDINLSNTYPISEYSGRQSTPYKFKIENTCSIVASYQVNLETLNSSTFNTDYLRILFNDTASSVLYSSDLEKTTPKLSNASSARKLITGTLQPDGSEGSSVEYVLKLWVDYNATEETENVMGKEWNGKISVYSVATT